jgi:hypothetical protein
MSAKPKTWQLPLVSTALGLLLAATGGPARPIPAFGATLNQLFTPTTLPDDLVEQAATQEKLNPDIVRTRYVTINSKALLGTDPVSMDLFDDVVVTVTRSRLEKRSADRYSWFGGAASGASSQVIFTFEKGAVAGDIRTLSRVYHLAYVGKGVHALRELGPGVVIDRDDFELICCLTPRQPAVNLLPPIVDLLVAYTTEAAAAAGSADAMEAQAQLSVDWVNQAYRNSKIRQILRLAYVYECWCWDSRTGVRYRENTDIRVRGQEAYGHLSDKTDGVIDDVHETAEMVGADLVSLFCSWGCGVAGIGGQSSIVNWDSPSTLAHEVGHNLGANHEKVIALSGGWFPYSNGYTYVAPNPSDSWHDIMAYGVECQFVCPEIPYFSNPNVSYNGVPTGKPDGAVDANGNSISADNARTLNETSPIVAAYREPPAMISIPATGGTVTTGQVTFTAQAKANVEYFWMFGTARDLADVIPWVPTGATSSATVTLPASVSGQTLWVRLYTRVGGPTGTWHFRDHTYSVQ